MVMKDIIQETRGRLKHPQVRVWVHPKKGGDDYYYTFKTLCKAKDFIFKFPKSKGRVEDTPLIAFGGYEMTAKEFAKKHGKKIAEVL